MDIPLWVPIVLMVVGVIGLIRATATVATGDDGRFRADPFVTIVLSFALLIPGQYLLSR